MSPVLDRIIDVADQITAILEAPRGLKHPRHQYHLAPAVREIKRVMAQYFERQKHAVLAAVKPHLQSHIDQFREAEGWENEERVPKGEPGAGEWVGGSGAAEEESTAASRERVERAKASAVRTGQHEQAIADRSEQVLSDAIGVPRTRDNSAFDLRNDDVGIEVKTLVNGKNEKITMSKTAFGRKIAEQRADELKAYTVVVDRRTGGLHGQATYYVREGLGSFRLGSMTKTTLSELRSMVRS
jgi:hypothetical protein